MIYKNLNPEKALIWRITHLQNCYWILANGMHAANSTQKSADWVIVGNRDLIDRRSRRAVPLAPGGVLSDYVPFYFTPFSPMLYNIHTGRGGVASVANSNIVILVSSLHRVAELGLPFLFTDRHAYTVTANYYDQLGMLSKVDWGLIQRRDFQRDIDDPEKTERYQAEALIYQKVPVDALLGAVCYTKEAQRQLDETAVKLGIELNTFCRPEWYF